MVLVLCPLDFSPQWEPECFVALLQWPQAILLTVQRCICLLFATIGHQEKCLSHPVHHSGTSGGWGLAVAISVWQSRGNNYLIVIVV